jgi:PAS domain S-box-containing protein
MKGLSTRVYLATGLAFLVASILLAAAFFGLLPDRGAALREGRTALAELAAVTSAAAVDPERVPRVQATLAFMLERNKDLVSVAVRRKDGAIVVSAGDHFAHWQPLVDDRSTDTQIQVPISANRERWGQLELKFRPTGVPSLFGMEMPWLYLAAYMLFGSLVAFYFYLGRVLRHLDPSQAVPGRVRAALDTLAEGLVVIDKKQTIVLANQAFASLLGATSESLLGKQLAGFGWIAPDGSPFQKDQFPWVIAMRAGALQRDCLVYLPDADGKLHMFHANCSPVIGGDGKTGGVLISLNDVTELEEQKVELRQAREEADAANRAKSDFLANMSHEIRTPMNAILGFTEVLRRGWGRNEREARRHLDTIHSSGKHLIELINDILDLSKVEAGRMEVERIACEPHQVLREVVKVLGVRARDKGITLGLEAARPIPAVIQSDPGRLRQIVTNLVGNALKFTERGGVRVVMRMAGTPAAPQLAIDVVDSGIGIPADKVDQLFQAFVQADTSVTRKFGGTGLGLVLSRNFARALGGDIAVASELGKGSTFTATIDTGSLAGVRMLQPAEITRVVDDVADEAHVRWEFPASRRVLVVDDGPENRELVALVLAEAGIATDEAENGQVAVDKATRTAYDAILMDMSMPVMDGFTATKLLRGRGMKLPIIALTAHAMKGFEKEILEAGCTGYVTKPIDIDVLLGALAEKLGGRRVQGAPVAPARPAPAPQPVFAASLDDAPGADGPPVVSRLATHPKLRPAIRRFAGRLDEQLIAMDGARNAGDFKELANLAHWLKGAGGTVGYDDFTAPARNLETFAKAGDGPGADAALREIRGLALRLVAPEEDDAQVAA